MTKTGPRKPAKTRRGASSRADFDRECAGLQPQRAAIYRYIHSRGTQGATAKEISADLAIGMQSVSAQVAYLKNEKLVAGSGSFRDRARVVLAARFYDPQRDGDESQRSRNVCNDLQAKKKRRTRRTTKRKTRKPARA